MSCILVCASFIWFFRKEKTKAFMLLSFHVRVSEWTYPLYLPECQGTPSWKQAPYQSPASSKDILDIQVGIECRFTLILVRVTIITYSLMHCTDKYSQHSSNRVLVWANKIRPKKVLVNLLFESWKTMCQNWYFEDCYSS